MCKQKITENEKRMQIANCRICLLCKSHCADCPLNWALKFNETIENPLKVIEISLKIDENFDAEKWLKLQPRQKKAKQIQEWLDADLKITLWGELS